MNAKLGWIAWNREVTRITQIGAKPTMRLRVTCYLRYRFLMAG